MANFGNQYIKISLTEVKQGGRNIVPPKRVAPHTHLHQDLEGLTKDDHPQYLTVDRAVDLIRQVIANGDITINPVTDARNLGDGLGVYAQNDNGILEFLTLRAGSNITLTQIGNEIVIEADGTLPPTTPITINTFTLSPTVATGVGAISGTLVEVGAEIVTVDFTATTNRTPDTGTLTDPDTTTYDITTLGAVLDTTLIFQWNGSVSVGATINQTIPWQLEVTEDTNSDTEIRSLTTAARSIWGADAPSGLDDADDDGVSDTTITAGAAVTIINNLGSNALKSGRATTFTADAGTWPVDNKKIYFAYPAAFGLADGTSDFQLVGSPFPGGFFQVQTDSPIFITNQYGQSIEYYLYESDQVGLGEATIEVS